MTRLHDAPSYRPEHTEDRWRNRRSLGKVFEDSIRLLPLAVLLSYDSVCVPYSVLLLRLIDWIN